MVFQEPMTSLNPLFTIGSQIEEAILTHQAIPRSAATAMAIELLETARIRMPRSALPSTRTRCPAACASA
jgi:peptide/nickel transport system ATP-binding protein